MADVNFTSEERMDIYRRLFLLNRSFHLIVMRLDELKPLFTAQDLKDMRGMTQEIQLGINTALLDSLDSAENDDWAQFGKVRLAMEKRLKTPLPERRRKH
jgi:hypothetical protein